jgi:hypothetical protein
MRTFKVGRHVIPLWLIIVLLISGIGGTLGYYVWRTLTIQVEVKEPIEILQYPSSLSLYPGETKDFNITVQNHASVNYSVIIDFHLNNTAYQTSYVNFSNEVYTVIPGQQDLRAWLSVVSEAPPTNVSLTIGFSRNAYPYSLINGLIGYWRFDEGSGTTVFDSSGNGNNGTLENNPTWVDGKHGTALKFDGIDDYVAIPDLYSTSPTELTVSAWINSSLVTTWWRGDSIIHHCRHGEFGLQLVYSGVICFGVKVASGVGLWDVRWNPSPNEWHQIVGTWKKGDSLKLYVDGTLVNQTAANDEFLYDAYWEDAAIGSLYRSEAFFNGTIDEVMVYNRTLSAGEVAAQYATPP